jgi:hypothetical protein
MKSVTVLLRSGARIWVKASKWTGDATWVVLEDDAGIPVSSFPTEAVAGVWFTEIQERIRVMLLNEPA